ncbi:MAG: hypothetical protein ACRCSL_07110 [Microbacterium sp.]
MIEHGLESGADLVAMEEDVLGEDPDGRVSEGCGGQVSPPVLLPSLPGRMELRAVALDDQPAVDHEVDPADSMDDDLDLEVATEGAKHKAHQRFGARLAPGVEEGPQGLMAAGESREHSREVGFVDESEMQRAVESGDRRSGVLALHGLCEGFDPVREERVGRSLRRPPVTDDPVRTLGEPAGADVDLHVERRRREHEDAEVPEQGETVQPAAQRARADHLFVHVGCDISPSAQADERSGGEGTIDPIPRKARLVKGSAGDERRHGGTGCGLGRHRSILFLLLRRGRAAPRSVGYRARWASGEEAVQPRDRSRLHELLRSARFSASGVLG